MRSKQFPPSLITSLPSPLFILGKWILQKDTIASQEPNTHTLQHFESCIAAHTRKRRKQECIKMHPIFLFCDPTSCRASIAVTYTIHTLAHPLWFYATRRTEASSSYTITPPGLQIIAITNAHATIYNIPLTSGPSFTSAPVILTASG